VRRPWKMDEWEVEQDHYAKKLGFGPGIGWVDNDDVDEEEQKANAELIKLTALMAEVILSDETYSGSELYDRVESRLREILADGEAAQPFDYAAWLADNAPSRCNSHRDGNKTGWANMAGFEGFAYTCGCLWGSDDGRGEGWTR